MQHEYSRLLTIDELANRLRLSRRWLQKEAAAGRIPSLLAGQRRFFNQDAVEQALLKRAGGAEIIYEPEGDI